MKKSLLRAALLIFTVSPALAGTEPVSDGLRHCSLEADEKKRLACFDALVTALPKIKSEQFGMTVEVAHRLDPASVSYSNSETLAGKITALRETPLGELIFTLDNGQVWLQASAQVSVHFVVGDAVQIEHGAMTSLWLTADHHRKTRVTRIR